jgi:hypothetical protein
VKSTPLKTLSAKNRPATPATICRKKDHNIK